MTERDTASLLRAALQRRAEDGMQATNTDRELDRLREQMAPVRRRRQLRVALAAVAAVAVIGGGVGLAVAFTSEGNSGTPAPPISPRPTPTTLPAGRLAAGFPIGTFSHPGGIGPTSLQISRNAVALVSGPDGTGRNQLTFVVPDVVIFNVTNTTDCPTPGRYQWSVARGELTLTALSDSCTPRRILLTELPWGPIVKTQTP